MINKLKSILKNIVKKWAIGNFEIEVSFSKIGDFSTNIAMKLAKVLKKSPIEIAEEIKKQISDQDIEKVEVSKPGFINFYLKNDYFQKQVQRIVDLDQNFGKGQQNKYINVEYVSVNPTGYLHAGHARGAIVGSVLSKLLKFAGNKVDQEYYINDAGNQIKILGYSTWIRYLQELKVKCELPEDSYKGEDIKIVAKYLIKKHGDKYKNRKYQEVSTLFEQESKDFLLNKIKEHLGLLDIKMDIYTSEKNLVENKKIDKVFEALKHYIFQKDQATWLKTTLKNDDKDRVLRKADGTITYFTSDIAYHQDKISRNYDELINVWGVDHIGYVQRIKTAVSFLGFENDNLDFLMINLVKLIKDKKEIKMSKRTGQSLTLLELLDLVPVDALKFFMVNKSVESGFSLDIDLVEKQTSENPVFTIQYTNARCNQLLNKSKVEPQIGFFEEKETNIINKLLEFADLIIKIANSHKIHLLPQYLIELCNLFNSFYSNVKIIGNKREKQLILLVKAVKNIIKNSLNILGISSPNKM